MLKSLDLSPILLNPKFWSFQSINYTRKIRQEKTHPKLSDKFDFIYQNVQSATQIRRQIESDSALASELSVERAEISKPAWETEFWIDFSSISVFIA